MADRLEEAIAALKDNCRGCREGWAWWPDGFESRGHRSPSGGWWPCRLSKRGQAFLIATPAVETADGEPEGYAVG